MADTRESWEEVLSRLNELGLKLQLHFEQAGSDEEVAAEEDRVKEALRTVGDAVEQAFGALGGAVKDDAVREDVVDVGRSVLEALDATFSELGERFRSAVKRD
jgi:Flp pilus assembly pilin Flp